MKLFKYIILFTVAILATSLLFISCMDDPEGPEPQEPDNGDIKRVVLVYGVASNNLSRFFKIDKAEMKEGLKGIDLSSYKLLIYSVDSSLADKALLEEAFIDSEGEIDFKMIRSYDREINSVDPLRVSRVISDVKEMYSSPHYGLFLWSHGGNWSPVPKSAPSKDMLTSPDKPVDDNLIAGEEPVMYNPVWAHWFGQDIDGGVADYGDIIDFCDAIPADTFDFIWFDACYMGSIEVLYQLKDKCDIFIGYPTEVWDEGCPYDAVIPFMMKENPQYIGAADAFFEFYANHSRPDKRNAVIGVFDTSALNEVADAASKIYSVGQPSDPDNLQVYTRSVNMSIPGYDFLQYTSGFGMKDNLNPGISTDEFAALKKEFSRSLDRMILYKNATEFDFSRKPINRDFFIPLSCHFYDGSQNRINEYYRLLNWFNAVYLIK